MGWEEDYDESDSEEEYMQDLESCLIDVDPTAILDETTLMMEEFYKKFNYSLSPEVESKTWIVSENSGYLAAHFTPKKFNRREKYYSLIYNPKFKRCKMGYKFTLDFMNGFYDEDGNECEDGELVTIAKGNNIQCIIDTMIKHWQREEQRDY